MNGTKVKTCPTCGNRRIKRVRLDATIQVGSFHFVVPNLEFDDCPDCGEQIFDLAAMEKIYAHRPSVGGVRGRKRKSA